MGVSVTLMESVVLRVGHAVGVPEEEAQGEARPVAVAQALAEDPPLREGEGVSEPLPAAFARALGEAPPRLAEGEPL